jgi:hypothetical protein
MNRIPLALFSDRSKAAPVQQRLAEAGLDTNINDSPPLSRLWFVSRPKAGVRVEVSAAQFERAKQLLIDWDSTEGALRDAIRCPECQSLRVDYPQYAKHSLLTNLALGLLATLGLVEKDYYCEDCHYTWPKEGAWPRRDRPHLAPFYFIEGVEQTRRAVSKQQPSNPAEEPRKAA